MSSLSFAALALWQLGYPDQALKSSEAAVTLAREVAHPLSLAFALDFAARCHQFRREGLSAQEQAEARIALSTEHGMPLFLAEGTISRGWALAEQGRGEEGITQMRQGLAAWQATGAGAFLPYFLALLADAYREVGQVDEGLGTVSEALTLVNRTGERFYEAELYRLKGTLTLQKFQVSSSEFQVPPSLQPLTPSTQAEAEAEACFLKAIDIAQQQQAKSWELRAATNLARLWQQQGKMAEAHKLLAEVYNWFTEGFDTKDLQEAKALIEELTESTL
jgi:predicted ATPase